MEIRQNYLNLVIGMKKWMLNGKELKRHYLLQSDIAGGAEIKAVLSDHR